MDIWLQTGLYPGVSLIASAFHHLSIPRTNITNITNTTNIKNSTRQPDHKYYKHHKYYSQVSSLFVPLNQFCLKLFGGTLFSIHFRKLLCSFHTFKMMQRQRYKYSADEKLIRGSAGVTKYLANTSYTAKRLSSFVKCCKSYTGAIFETDKTGTKSPANQVRLAIFPSDGVILIVVCGSS